MAHDGLTAEFLFDLFEASSAFEFASGGCFACACNFGAGFGVYAPTVSGGGVHLFGFIITIAGAMGHEKTDGSDAGAFLRNLNVARAFRVHIRIEGDKAGGGDRAVAFDLSADAGAFNFGAGALIDAPDESGGTVELFGGELAIFVASWYEVADVTNWAQSQSALFIAEGALGLASWTDAGSGDFFASVRYYAPAMSGGAVALFSVVISVFRALGQEFAGHFGAQLPFFGARTWLALDRGGGGVCH